jgi:hypothetical protein
MKSLNSDRVVPAVKINGLYPVFSLTLALIFALVGLIFLLMPGGVLIFFNSIARQLGMVPAPADGFNFYTILAVAYMYLVTLLAYRMYRHPEKKEYPVLLIHAKAASSILSLSLFIFHQPYLIFITNAVVDGTLAAVVWLFYRQYGRKML